MSHDFVDSVSQDFVDTRCGFARFHEQTRTEVERPSSSRVVAD